MDTRPVTAAVMRIERSGPAIREALARYAPAECLRFESEFGRALNAAAKTFDLVPAQGVLDRWWGIAVTRANPLSEAEQAQLARARTGDFAGLLAHDERGNWVRL